MNKNILKLTLLFGLILTLNEVMAVVEPSSQLMHVSANVLEPFVGIQVPDSISLGQIAPGYLSNRSDLDISNVGTSSIKVTPEVILNESNPEPYSVFSNLAFRNVLDDPLLKIGNYSIDILKPTVAGGNRTERVYMYLDLTEYTGTAYAIQEMYVTFWATPL